jgi:hypothetical protein
MDLWWVLIGLAAWFGVAVVIGLCIGPVLRRCSQVRESIDQQWDEISDGHESPRDERQASEGWLSTGAGGGEPVPDPRRARGPAIVRRG